MEEDYKKLCQVFTPKKVVEQMLNWCNYKSELYGKKVIENSCGDRTYITRNSKKIYRRLFEK